MRLNQPFHFSFFFALLLFCFVQSGRVWDYTDDQYVHRLIQNRADGKLVRVADANYDSIKRSQRSSGTGNDNNRNNENDGNSARSGQVGTYSSFSKIDAIAEEYNYLLTAQLESQRIFFEEKMASDNRKKEEEIQTLVEENLLLSETIASSASGAKKGKWEGKKGGGATSPRKSDNNNNNSSNSGGSGSSSNTNKSDSANVKKLNKKVRTLEKMVQRLVQEVKVGKKDNEFFRHINRALEANRKIYEEENKKKERRISDLEDQVKDLMFFVESREKAQHSSAKGGSLVISNSNSNRSRRKKGR